MQHCDNLVQFIVGNGHGPAYVQRFNNCVGGGSQVPKIGLVHRGTRNQVVESSVILTIR